MWGIGKAGKAGESMHGVLQDLVQLPYSGAYSKGLHAQGGLGSAGKVNYGKYFLEVCRFGSYSSAGCCQKEN